MPIASVFICLDDLKVMDEGGYHEAPFVVPRWTKSSDEMYGRGLGHIALPDTKTLNRAKELGLKAWAKEIDPPLLVQDAGVIGNVRTTPGGQTVVREPNSVQTLDLKIRHDSNRFNTEQLIQSIRGIFFTDQLRMKESPQMTAEEVRARMELMHRTLGPTLGRLEKELLNRMIERTFAIMMRAGALDDPPDAVVEAYKSGMADIDIEYEGPLARAQRNVEAEAIDIFLAGGLPLIQAGVPDALDALDMNKAMIHKAKIIGVPESVMASEEEMKGKAQAETDQDATDAKASVDMANAAKTAGEVRPPSQGMLPL
jgi:hypothetical protein